MEEGNGRGPSNSTYEGECGMKAEKTTKVSGPFPLLSFDCYCLFHVWSFSYFMKQASWNSWNLLCFIGQVMISGIQFDNHTLEEYQTLKIEYSTLNEENKGL